MRLYTGKKGRELDTGVAHWCRAGNHTRREGQEVMPPEIQTHISLQDTNMKLNETTNRKEEKSENMTLNMGQQRKEDASLPNSKVSTMQHAGQS